MAKLRKERAFATLLAIVGLEPLAASANVEWEFQPNTCDDVPGNSRNTFTDSLTFKTSLGADVTATGWANTTSIDNEKLQQGEMQQYSGGLGVRNADADSTGNDLDQ